MRQVAIRPRAIPMRGDNGSLGAYLQDAVQFVGEMNALFGREMFDEVAAIDFLNGTVLPRPRLAKVQHNILAEFPRIHANETWLRILPAPEVKPEESGFCPRLTLCAHQTIPFGPNEPA